MDFPLTLVDMAGAVALLLWGVHMVQTGVQRAFGAKLRGFLTHALRSPPRAFLAGLVVTAILQSSTATGLMVAGFAAGGLVDLVPGLTVMLGANVGTTLIVQILSFNVAACAPVLILTGLLMFRKGKAGLRDFGRVMIGLGLIMTALPEFVSLLSPYEVVPGFRGFIQAIVTQPLLDVGLAAILTWAAHSSVAVVLLVMSFAAKGILPPEAAFALVLGANLGTAINPVLEGSGGDNPVSRRLPVGNLINRIIGVALVLGFLPIITPVLSNFEPDTMRAVADFHTAFNLILAVAFFPLLKPFSVLLKKLFPERVQQGDPAEPLYLNPAVRETPVIALGACAREALRLADILEAMLLIVRSLLEKNDRRQLQLVKRMDDTLDKLNRSIKSYLTSFDKELLTEDDHARITEILTFTINLEHAGDIVDRGLVELTKKKIKRGIEFSVEGQFEILEMIDRLIANIRSTATVFMTGDKRAIYLLGAEKEIFQELEAKATRTHFMRLQSGRSESIETSAMHLDALRDLKAINAHLVASVEGLLVVKNSEGKNEKIRALERHEVMPDLADSYGIK